MTDKTHMVAVPGGWVRARVPDFSVLDSTTVDESTWYTVKCSKRASIWIRETYQERENDLWYQHIDSRWMINATQFDVHEKLYTMLSLRWS
jgi:hypothetical protein